MSCSAIFLLEVSQPVLLKVISEDYLRGKKRQNFAFLTL